MAAELIAFKSLFPSPFGYVNFGESNRELNKQLVEDIEIHRGKHDDLVTAGGVYASQWTIQTGDMAV